MWHSHSNQECSLDLKNELFSCSNNDPALAVCYQIVPALPCTASHTHTPTPGHIPSTGDILFMLIHLGRTYLVK